MIKAFLESIKYVGHFYPISFLRIYLGFFFLNVAFAKLDAGYLTSPLIAAEMREAIARSTTPSFYANWLEAMVIPQWEIFSRLSVWSHFILGGSYIAGLLVRPVALLGLMVAVHGILVSTPESEAIEKMFFALHLTLFALGAGRCLGFDYYFYKRRRGFWW